MFAGRKWELLFIAACGIAVGAAFSGPGAWLIVQVGFVSLCWRLLAAEHDARRAGLLATVFTAGVYAIGHAGAAFSVSESLRPWTLAIWAFVAFGHAAVAGLTTGVAFRLPVSTAVRLLFAVPALWIGREWLATVLDTPGHWLAVGYAHAPNGPFAALFPVGGVFLVSWAAVAASAVLALACRRAEPQRQLAAVVCIVASAAGLVAIGNLRWTQATSQSVVELVQPGVSAESDSSSAATLRALKFYADTVATSTAALIVTPQLALPKIPEALPPGYLAALDARLRQNSADALLGMHFDSDRVDVYFNGVQTLGQSGAQRYLKHHLLPFGEFMPFPDSVNRWIQSAMAEPRSDGARGPVAREPLHGGGLRLALAVCYEAAFGNTIRLQAASANAIVNMSSDATHDSSQLARQLQQVAQARAREFQKPLMRTSDVRGTYFIDAEGNVTAELAAYRSGTLNHTVEGRTGLTPYARWGDMLPLGIGATALLICVLSAGMRGSTFGRITARRANTQATRLGAPRSARQAGQVLPVAIALLVVIAGFFYLMVNAGQAVTEKIRVTNAADAAAYSAAVVEARALNYNAYLNRALVANEMAIAQTISFSSWLAYFATASDTFGSYGAELNFFLLPNPDVAVLDVAFAGSAAVAAYFGGSTVKEYLDYLINYGASAIIIAHQASTLAIMKSQAAVSGNLAAGIRQGQIADQVVQAMDPTLHAEVVPVSHGFDTFTKYYFGDERSRLADVAVRSRDPFTRERNFTLDSYDIPVLRKNPALKKRGGTELIGLDEWRGIDTLELHGQRFGCGKLGVSWCKDVRTPIGWGGINVDAGGGGGTSGYHGNAYGENPTTARKADGDMESPAYALYMGIPPNQEIVDVDPTKEPSTSISVRVFKSHPDTLTSGNASEMSPTGALALFSDRPAGGQLAALSRAEVFFDRIAPRADGKTELGSLYNPYWRVRLVSPTLADRGYAATRQGGLALP